MKIVGVTGQAGAGKDEVSGRLVKCHDFKQLSLADPLKRFGFNVFEFDVVQLWGPSSARNTFDPRYKECNIRSSGVDFSPGCNMKSVLRQCDPGWGETALRLVDYGPKWVSEVVAKDQQEEALEKLYFWFASLGHHYAELSPRIMLQHLGTEYGRQAVSEDIWIDALISTAKQVLAGSAYTREKGVSSEVIPPPAGVVVSDVRFLNELKAIHAAGGKIIRITREEASRKAQKLGISGHASEAEQLSFSDDMFDAVLANEGTLEELYTAVDIVAAAHLGSK